jgi:protein-arginine kinase activator protein McsA
MGLNCIVAWCKHKPDAKKIHLTVCKKCKTTFKIIRNNNYKFGMNCQSNSFHVLNDKIQFLWWNQTLTSFKIECKKLLLTEILTLTTLM